MGERWERDERELSENDWREIERESYGREMEERVIGERW